MESLRQRENQSKNERVKSLIQSGVDLIAKEAEYRKSCRIQFLNETADQDEPRQQRQSYHKDAFANLVAFIQCEVLEKHLSVLVSDLLNMYREEYTNLAGEEKDVQAYTAQNLTRKLKEHFKAQIKVSLINQRKGNFIYSSSMSEEDAQNSLNEVGQRYEEDNKLRWASLHLRSQIMQLPKTKTPNPATVENLKQCAPVIPNQLDLFFRSLFGGIRPSCSDTVDRKVTAMGSDAIYNVTRGSVKPWKHTALDLA